MSVVQEEEEPDVFNESMNERSASFISTTIWINNHSRNLEHVSLEISNKKNRIFGFFTKSENGLSISRIHPKWIRYFLYDLSVCLPDLNKLHIVSGLLAGPHHYCFHVKKSFGFSIRVICDQESNRTCILLFCQKEGLREPLNFKDEKAVAEVCVKEPSGQLLLLMKQLMIT